LVGHFCKPKTQTLKLKADLAPYYFAHVGVVRARLFKASWHENHDVSTFSCTLMLMWFVSFAIRLALQQTTGGISIVNSHI